MAQSILRLPTVRARTGLSRSTIYRMISEGSFPKPVPLGRWAVGWPDSAIDQWIESRVEAAQNAS